MEVGVILYLYYCPYCDHSFEVNKPMADASCLEQCQRCGIKAIRKYTVTPAHFGWRLTEASHIRGNQDEFEKDI